MSVNSKMTAIANEVRELSGTSGKMGLDSIATNISNANDEIANQVTLLSQAISALEGKSAGGNGGIELPTLTNPATASDILSGKEAINGSGQKITGTIATKTSSNLTASGATVTVPSGYYANQATKSISNGSAKTPATTVTKNPSISINSSGLITASVSGTQNVTPTVTAGYVSSGTAGTITVSGSATKQLTTQAATTYTPTTSNQTIASGTYLTGTQTVKGDSNLVASNIKSGVSIFGVTGTYDGGGGSGGVETCTVTISADADAEVYYIVYSHLDSTIGKQTTEIISYTNEPDGYISNITLTLENVICGTSITIFWGGPCKSENLSSNIGMITESHRNICFIAPSNANDTGTIQLIGDD